MEGLDVPDLIISDELSGLKSISRNIDGLCEQRKEKKLGKISVMSVCAVHVASNLGITDRQALNRVMCLARSPNKEMYDWFMNHALVDSLVTKTQAIRLHERRREYSFVNMQEKGVDTCWGVVTTNQAESFNCEILHCRNGAVVGFLLSYLTTVRNQTCVYINYSRRVLGVVSGDQRTKEK